MSGCMVSASKKPKPCSMIRMLESAMTRTIRCTSLGSSSLATRTATACCLSLSLSGGDVSASLARAKRPERSVRTMKKGKSRIDGERDDELRAEYKIDYRQTRPNPYAGRVKFSHGGARP